MPLQTPYTTQIHTQFHQLTITNPPFILNLNQRPIILNPKTPKSMPMPKFRGKNNIWHKFLVHFYNCPKIQRAKSQSFRLLGEIVESFILNFLKSYKITKII